MEDQSGFVDRPREMTLEASIDVEVLRQVLCEQMGSGSSLRDLRVMQFGGGHSNLTYLVEAGDEKWVLRTPPKGLKAKSAHDMGREYHMLRALEGVYGLSPKPYFYCEDDGILGVPFYLMEYKEGVILRRRYPKGWVKEASTVAAQCRAWVDALVRLHRIDVRKNGLEHLGRPVGYVDRQLFGWQKRLEQARTAETLPFEGICEWLAERRTNVEPMEALIHNDYKLDNVIWDLEQPEQMIGVLDWEMATLGHPLMDFGCAMAYWTDPDDPDYVKAFEMVPTREGGSWTRAEVCDYYRQEMGLREFDEDFFYVFGLFRLAGICQQIYHRYVHKQTSDERFAKMIHMVNALQKRCIETIESAS